MDNNELDEFEAHLLRRFTNLRFSGEFTPQNSHESLLEARVLARLGRINLALHRIGKTTSRRWKKGVFEDLISHYVKSQQFLSRGTAEFPEDILEALLINDHLDAARFYTEVHKRSQSCRLALRVFEFTRNELDLIRLRRHFKHKPFWSSDYEWHQALYWWGKIALVTREPEELEQVEEYFAFLKDHYKHCYKQPLDPKITLIYWLYKYQLTRQKQWLTKSMNLAKPYSPKDRDFEWYWQQIIGQTGSKEAKTIYETKLRKHQQQFLMRLSTVDDYLTAAEETGDSTYLNHAVSLVYEEPDPTLRLGKIYSILITISHLRPKQQT